MPLATGSRLGVYEVVAPLGAGGMGEVYRGRDTKLGRAVALKILPDAVAGDPERIARFEREAQILASLNHPHIAAIYGLEEHAGSQFLVLELVDGESLDKKLSHGSWLKAHGSSEKPSAISHQPSAISHQPSAAGLPLEEALNIARQIADALQAAHEKGIIHRDLKPANVALTLDGVVKVLDFGLAKLDAPEAGAAAGADGLTHSPTLTFAGTQAGVILGTAAYMSPEQAKGRVADKRSDIWAFGCVLFEMLAGKRAFAGEDITDVITAIMRDEPDWGALPPTLPATIRTLLARCLTKDRKARIADISVAQFLLTEPSPGAAPAAIAAPPARTPRLWTLVAGMLALTTVAAAGLAAWLYVATPPRAVGRFFITPPEKAVFVTAGRTGSTVAISPDGTRLAFTARDESGKIQIWLRPIAALTAQPLAGTDGAEFPFWSPDSRSLGYFANGKLMRIDANGGPAQTLCAAEGARGGAWGPTGVIVFGAGRGNGLSRVPAAGGQPAAVTQTPNGDDRFPSFLPDGRHLLFFGQRAGAPDAGGIFVVDIDGGTPKRITAAGSTGLYVAPGYLLFVRQATLLAQRFDSGTHELTGEPTLIAESVESGVFGGILGFSASETGVLAYGIGTGRTENPRLGWYDRQGKLTPFGQEENYLGIDLSPDESRIAVHRHEQTMGGDLWIVDVKDGVTSRFTFDAALDHSAPLWSPDGSRIAYTSLRKGRWPMYVKPSNGTGAESVLVDEGSPRSWSRDGQYIAYIVNGETTSSDIWILPLGGDRKPFPFQASRFAEGGPQISPDGKWLAYHSDETGMPEVYVRPFPTGDGKWQISSGGGEDARWRGDSKELFYANRPQLSVLMAVDVSGNGAIFTKGIPHRLFDLVVLRAQHTGPGGYSRWAASRDGQRFLAVTNPRSTTFANTTSPPIAVMLNWTEALKK